MFLKASELLPTDVVSAAQAAGLDISCEFSESEERFDFTVALADDRQSNLTLADWPGPVGNLDASASAWLDVLSGTAGIVKEKSPALGGAVESFCGTLADSLGRTGEHTVPVPVVMPDFLREAISHVNLDLSERCPAAFVSCELACIGDNVTCTFAVDGRDDKKAVMTMTPEMATAPDDWPLYLSNLAESAPADSALRQVAEQLGGEIYRIAAADLGLGVFCKTYLDVGCYDNGRVSLAVYGYEMQANVTVETPAYADLDADIVFVNEPGLSEPEAENLIDRLGLTYVPGVEIRDEAGNAYKGYRLDMARLMQAAPCCFDRLPEELQNIVAEADGLDIDEAWQHADQRVEHAHSAAADIDARSERGGSTRAAKDDIDL